MLEETRLARNAYMREWKRRNKEKINAWNKQWKDANREQVREAGREYMAKIRIENPQKLRDAVKRYANKNPEKVKALYDKFIEKNPEYHANWRLKNLQKWILKSAKSRAKQSGIMFNLELEDIIIPEFCPVLGIKLDPSAKRGRAEALSLDRVKPELGYIKGNVRVISTRANRIKNDASLEDLENLVKYVKDHFR